MKFNKAKTSQPRKKRKALYHAEIHSMKRMLRMHLSKDLRKRYNRRSLLAKKGDKVKVLRGEFKKKEGKLAEVDAKEGKVYVEGIIQKKQGGKEVFVALEPSNCILIEYEQPKKKFKGRRTKEVKVEKKEPSKKIEPKKIETKVESNIVQQKEKTAPTPTPAPIAQNSANKKI